MWAFFAFVLKKCISLLNYFFKIHKVSLVTDKKLQTEKLQLFYPNLTNKQIDMFFTEIFKLHFETIFENHMRWRNTSNLHQLEKKRKEKKKRKQGFEPKATDELY